MWRVCVVMLLGLLALPADGRRGRGTPVPTTGDKFLTSASYSGTPQPVSFWVSIDNSPFVSVTTSIDGSSNAYLSYDLTVAGWLVGSGAHVAEVIGVDSSGDLSPTASVSFTL